MRLLYQLAYTPNRCIYLIIRQYYWRTEASCANSIGSRWTWKNLRNINWKLSALQVQSASPIGIGHRRSYIINCIISTSPSSFSCLRLRQSHIISLPISVSLYISIFYPFPYLIEKKGRCTELLFPRCLLIKKSLGKFALLSGNGNTLKKRRSKIKKETNINLQCLRLKPTDCHAQNGQIFGASQILGTCLIFHCFQLNHSSLYLCL